MGHCRPGRGLRPPLDIAPVRNLAMEWRGHDGGTFPAKGVTRRRFGMLPFPFRRSTACIVLPMVTGAARSGMLVCDRLDMTGPNGRNRMDISEMERRLAALELQFAALNGYGASQLSAPIALVELLHRNGVVRASAVADIMDRYLLGLEQRDRGADPTLPTGAALTRSDMTRLLMTLGRMDRDIPLRPTRHPEGRQPPDTGMPP